MCAGMLFGARRMAAADALVAGMATAATQRVLKTIMRTPSEADRAHAFMVTQTMGRHCRHSVPMDQVRLREAHVKTKTSAFVDVDPDALDKVLNVVAKKHAMPEDLHVELMLIHTMARAVSVDREFQLKDGVLGAKLWKYYIWKQPNEKYSGQVASACGSQQWSSAVEST